MNYRRLVKKTQSHTSTKTNLRHFKDQGFVNDAAHIIHLKSQMVNWDWIFSAKEKKTQNNLEKIHIVCEKQLNLIIIETSLLTPIQTLHNVGKQLTQTQTKPLFPYLHIWNVISVCWCWKELTGPFLFKMTEYAPWTTMVLSLPFSPSHLVMYFKHCKPLTPGVQLGRMDWILLLHLSQSY